MKSKVFITGATGFVGSHVCAELEEKQIDYLAMVRSCKDIKQNREKYIEASLQDKARMEQILRDYQPDAVLHLAAVASPTFGEITQIYDVNVTGSENLLEAARQSCKEGTRVVFASTAGVYGNQEVNLLHEKLPYNPVNHYSYSKMVMEFLSENYMDDLDIHIVRPFNMIGIGQQEKFLVPKLVNSYVKKIPTLKLGNMDTVRDYIDINYAAKVFVELLTKDVVNNRIYNICTGKATKGTELLQMLSDITGYQPEIEITSEFVRKNEIWHMVGDPKRLENFMKSAEKSKSVREILLEMVQMYQEENV